MKTKIKNWFMSIDDKTLLIIGKAIEVSFYLWIGYSISKW